MPRRETADDVFARSVEKHDSDGSWREYIHPFDEILREYRTATDDSGDPLVPGGEFVLEWMCADLLSLHHHYRNCESVIERMFLSAFIVSTASGVVVASKSLSSTVVRDCMYHYYTVDLQKPIDRYRVDFLVTSHWPSSTGDPVNKRLIVECDGHDYHERTKEQAARDRARDRRLHKLGYSTFRYTGSEIWKDVLACAEECMSNLLPEVEEIF